MPAHIDQFPKFAPVRQTFPDRSLGDVERETRLQLSGANLLGNLPKGSKIAVGAGSRGIRDIVPVVRAVISYLREAGMEPFLFPAMGSHGSATAEGQANVLRHFGLTEDVIGCPIRSSLEVVSLGKTAEGVEALMDRHAAESDGVLLVNRIKWHTSFSGALESGLFKMMAIGLGKLAGAEMYHAHGYRIGMETVIRSAGRLVLSSGKILGGVAIAEDANHRTAAIAALSASEMELREEEILRMVKSWMPALPVSPIDILILDEIGKIISGTGMDTKVVNRTIRGQYNPWPELPRVERIFVRSLSPESYGNGVGVGLADVIHDRVLTQIDWPTSYVNSLTAGTPTGSRTPIHFGTDRECLERIGPTVGKFDLSTLRIVWIRNTLELSDLMMSETLLEEIQGKPNLSVTGPLEPLAFDTRGDLLAEAWRTAYATETA